MSPYIIIGLVLAGVLKLILPPRMVSRVAGGKGPGVPVISSLAGVPMPLCSCSVLPFALGLRKEGASKGAVVSFLTSTPQTGVDSILVSYSFFGLPFALFKVAVSFVSGTVAGWLVNWKGRGTMDKGGKIQTLDWTSGEEEDHCGCSHGEGCCSEKTEKEVSGWREKLGSVFVYAFDELLGDFAFMLFIGVIASALVGALVPRDLISGFQQRWVLYPAVLLLSVPLYICATASVPLAFALMQAGLPPGAAMVLLVAGPATNIATIGIVGKVLGRRTGFLYVFTILLAALAGGILFDKVIGGTGGGTGSGGGTFDFPWILQLVFSVILGGLMVFHFFRAVRARIVRRSVDMET